MVTQSQRRFAAFAWSVLVFNILVIIWGAYVRASFSGDGCGAHWPFCNGDVIPHAAATKTIVEFTHRVMTGLDTPLVIGLVIWAFSVYPRAHTVRRHSVLTLIFLVIEALLGAGLVLFRYVASDASVGRAIYLSAHLTNTLLLLSALTITAWLASTGADRLLFGSAPALVKGALPVALLVCITGGIAALGDTLFPATSLTAGMQQDFSNASSMLLRLRMVHPVIAILGAAYLLWAAVGTLQSGSSSGPSRTAATRVLTVTLLQVFIGTLNIALLAPVWMQLIHLLMADALWITVLLIVLESASAPRAITMSAPNVRTAAV
ncbi:MAG TPA: COX15/CtaA family protein [Bryobacteraceae bacterium]|jgi:heme A synthase|nr:COX15/CtaA family protein [Bryobacteraceae bacterium]